MSDTDTGFKNIKTSCFLMTRNEQAESSPQGLPGGGGRLEHSMCPAHSLQVSCILLTRAAGIFSLAKVTQGKKAGIFTVHALITLEMNSQKLFQSLYIKDIADELCIDSCIVKYIQICFMSLGHLEFNYVLKHIASH